MNMDMLDMIFGMTKGRYSPSMPSMPEGDMADIQDGFDRASILQKCQGINSCTKEMRDRKEYKEAKEYLESHPEELANYLHMPTKADKVDTLFLDGFERWAGYYAALDITQPKNT
jgi:hypothetical protein